MRLKNGTYDKIKWTALAFIPALEVLILTVGKIWGLPYGAEVAATLDAVALLIGTLIGISQHNIKKEEQE